MNKCGLEEGYEQIRFGGGILTNTVWRRDMNKYGLQEGYEQIRFGGGI